MEPRTALRTLLRTSTLAKAWGEPKLVAPSCSHPVIQELVMNRVNLILSSALKELAA
jgi:hypothetical protein